MSDAQSECGTSCSIAPFIFEGAVGQAKARGWEATVSRVGSQIQCRIAAWVGKLPAFIITLPETFAHPPASQHASSEAGGVCGSTLSADDDSGSEFASVVRWQFERPAVGVAAAVQSELKQRLSYSSHFSDRHKQRQATESLTVTNAAQLVDALAIVGSSVLAE